MSTSTRPAEVRRSIHSGTAAPARPALRVIEGGKKSTASQKSSPRAKAKATRALALRPFLRFGIGIAFLGVSLVGSLLLRTQMVQDSFEVTQLQTSIGVLTQDVQDDQTTLDGLESSLPDKAANLGMVPQSSTVTLDISKNAQ